MKKVSQNEEIDLIAIFLEVWKRKFVVVRITGVCILIGLIIALTSPEEYRSSSTLIPEITGESSLGGSLGGLASLAGVNLGGMSANEGMNPGLYRKVAQSTSFLTHLMKQEFYFQRIGSKISLYEYAIEYQRTSLVAKVMAAPRAILSWFKPESKRQSIPDYSVILLTAEEEAVVEDLMSRILVTMDWDLFIVTIDVEMQDAFVAAQVVEFTRDYITQYVTDYSVSKSQSQLEFVESQFQIRKEEFEDIQNELAIFRDENQFASTAKARSQEERLNSKYSLALTVYNQLAQQVETIKLQINENTPVFTVLDPARVPLKKSKPRRILILFISGILGIFFGVGVVLVQQLKV